MSNNKLIIREKQSATSKMIQLIMGLLGMKKLMYKKIITDKFNKIPDKIPASLHKSCEIKTENIFGRNVWTVNSKNNVSNIVVIFFHGGAYYANITTFHWQLIEQLALRTNASIVVPDYPLAPASSCSDAYDFTYKLYNQIIAEYLKQKIVIMGDSAGGALALGFSQHICNANLRQPDHIVLFSPWLDATLNNPEIWKFDKLDKILHIDALKIAAKNYAEKLELTDYRVSPIYGDFANLSKLTIFVCTHEIFVADTRKLHIQLNKQNIQHNYFEFPQLFHDWVIVQSLPETKEVLDWLESYFKKYIL